MSDHPNNDHAPKSAKNETPEGVSTKSLANVLMIIGFVIAGIVAIIIILLKISGNSQNSSGDTTVVTSSSQHVSTVPTQTLSALLGSSSSGTLEIKEKMVLVLDLEKVLVLHHGTFICDGKKILDSDHTPPDRPTWIIEPIEGNNAFLTFKKL